MYILRMTICSSYIESTLRACSRSTIARMTVDKHVKGGSGREIIMSETPSQCSEVTYLNLDYAKALDKEDIST